MTVETEIHNHSFEVQEIIEAVPSWTTRWGTLTLSLTFTLIVLACATIKLPVINTYQVNLKLINQPFYLIRKPGYVVLNLSLNKIVKGQALAINNLTKDTIKAPYCGMISSIGYDSLIKDTSAVLTPQVVNYNFTGKIAIKFLNILKVGNRIKINVTSRKLKQDLIAYGKIKGFSTVSSNNEVMIYGTLDKQSNQVFRNDLLYSSNVDGTSEMMVSEKTIFNMLLGND